MRVKSSVLDFPPPRPEELYRSSPFEHAETALGGQEILTFSLLFQISDGPAVFVPTEARNLPKLDI